MANVEKNVEVVETVKSVTLDLSLDEAQILVTLLGRCKRGSSTSQMYIALTEAGITKGDWVIESHDSGYLPVPTLVVSQKTSAW